MNFFQERIHTIRKQLKKYSHERKKARYKRKARRKRRIESRRQRWAAFRRRVLPSLGHSGDSVSRSDGEGGSKHPAIHFLYYAANSTALYMIAYILLYMIYQLTVLVMASFWGLDSVLFYYDLAFNDYSPLWHRWNIILITFSGPFIALVIGLAFYNFFAKKQKSRKLLKLLFIWIGLHGINFFLGAFASGVSFNEGFGYVANWLYFNVFLKILISLVFLFALGIIGYYSTGRFLDTSNSIYRIRKENRAMFLLSQAVIPWFAGGLIIFLIRMPNNMPYDTGILITMFFAVIPVLFNTKAKPTEVYDRVVRRQTAINWAYIALFILLFAAYRIGLNTGLHVILKMRFSIDITPI